MTSRSREALRSRATASFLVTVALAAWTLPGNAATGGRARGDHLGLPEDGWALSLERIIGEHVDGYAPRREGDAVVLDGAGGDVRGAVHAGGVTITLGGRTMGLSLAALGRAGDVRRPSASAPSIAGAEARIEHGAGVTEWFRALPSGLEHGFTLASRAPGEGPLALTLAVTGELTVRASAGRDVELVADDGAVVARYGQLFALDADARRLPARMRARNGDIVLEVDDRAARYPVVIDPLVVLEEGLLVPAGVASGDRLGVSVSISDDGSRAIVGAPSTASGSDVQAGAAYVFVRRGITWTLEATLRRPGGGAFDRFGSAVAISGDGTVVLASAPEATEVSCDCSVGGVWAFARSGTSWGTGVRLVPTGGVTASDRLGNSVGLTRDGSRAVVGALHVGSDRGEVYVFRRGPTWTEEARVRGTNAVDLLGASVAISADGTRVIAGMPGWDTPPSNSGGARILSRSDTTWTVEATIVPSIATSSSEAGYSVALSEDGSRAIVAAWRADVGATNAGGASVFLRSGTAWAEEGTLLSAAPRAGALLGDSVSISADGRRALVGGRGGAVGAVVSGTAHVFVRDATSWTEASSFAATGAASGDAFGSAVAMSGDGRRGVVGAPDDDAPLANSGSARAFTFGADDGTSCTEDVDCGSGHCVDGVCCESACGGGAPDCEACANALSGAADGLCAPALSGTVCRASAGYCDPAETCNGEAVVCPVDDLYGVSVVCRESMHPVCDPVETCDDVSVDCPADVWAPVETACGTVPSGACDLPDHCQGTGPLCVEEYVAAGTTCNSAPIAGPCDTADVCTGDRPDCPATFLSGVQCRASSGGCDPAEICLGTAADCPDDALSPPGTVCRASSDLSCDPLESCDGIAAACPANVNTCPDYDAGPEPPSDAATDASGPPTPATGCSCRTMGGTAPVDGAAAIAVGFAAIAVRRRRRDAARRCTSAR